MTTIQTHTTRASGTVLTASIYNSDHTVHVTNAQNLNSDKLEGATPPVTQGNVCIFADTTGAAIADAGFAPVNVARNLTAGTGLTGGGNLSADRSFAVDFASQAEAETGTDTSNVLNALRGRQLMVKFQATQAEAEAASDNTKTMTPLRTRQQVQAFQASQAEAQAGADNTKIMTPLRVAQSIAALVDIFNLGSALTSFHGGAPWDTGVTASGFQGLFAFDGGSGVSTTLAISFDGGSNYLSTNIINAGGHTIGLLWIDGGKALAMGIDSNNVSTVTVSPPTVYTPAAGAGNIFIRTTNSGRIMSGIRVL